MGALRCLALLAPALIVGAACGRQDIELVPDAGIGASFSGDGGDPCHPTPGSPRACQANGAVCSADVECCSSRCSGAVNGRCLEPGTCAGPGAACAARAECCSGRCEPIGGVTVCLNYCQADGEACSQPYECCSMACNNGTCGGSLCRGEDDNCSSNAACCSGVCSGGVCRNSSPCRGTLQSCEGTCCSGTCIVRGDGGEDGRCDMGPGPCRPVGTVCQLDSDCCRGTCAPGPSFVKVCTAPCLADGKSCAFATDCCAKICTGSPPTCGAGAAAAQCKLLGVACAGSDECCSGQCKGGACVDLCQPK